jgi:hypothetical protein
VPRVAAKAGQEVGRKASVSRSGRASARRSRAARPIQRGPVIRATAASVGRRGVQGAPSLELPDGRV